MERLWKALLNSFRAFRRLTATEKAVQQEMMLLIVAIPVAWLIADTWDSYFLLVLSVVFLIVVEVLNTAIEATCNAISASSTARPPRQRSNARQPSNTGGNTNQFF